MTRKKRSVKKRLFKSRAVQIMLASLIALIVRVIYLTARVEKNVPPVSMPYMTGEKPAIFCFWHGRMIMHLLVKPPPRDMYVLSSHHADGALIAAVMRWFGIKTVRGSRSRGSAKALYDLFRITEGGSNIAITPDGPRGPFQKAALGAAYIAAKTGYPIVPVTFSATRHARFRSWDKFMLPKLFSRIVFVVGEPITIPADDHDALRGQNLLMENALVRITAEADTICKVTP